MSDEDGERWQSETSAYRERLIGTALIDEAPPSIRATWKEAPYTLAEQEESCPMPRSMIWRSGGVRGPGISSRVAVIA